MGAIIRRILVEKRKRQILIYSSFQFFVFIMSVYVYRKFETKVSNFNIISLFQFYLETMLARILRPYQKGQNQSLYFSHDIILTIFVFVTNSITNIVFLNKNKLFSPKKKKKKKKKKS